MHQSHTESYGLTAAVCVASILTEWRDLCLLFIHPRAPNLISLRSAGTMLA